MLKKNIKDYSLNIFREIGDNWALLTAGDKSIGYNTLTVSWGGIGVIWGKNVAYVFVRKSRYTYDFLEKSESVTLSFLDNKYKDAYKIMGTLSGKDHDKMKLANLHYTYDPDYNGSYITESKYCFKMKKLYSVDLPYDNLPLDIKERYYPDGDMHTMYVCEIKQFLVKNEG